MTTTHGIAWTMAEIKRRNHEIGHHFFDRDTMRFFRGRIAPGIVPLPDDSAALFIHSIQFQGGPPQFRLGPRQYKIALAHPDGTIVDYSTLGLMGPTYSYPTLAAARRVLQAYMRGYRVRPAPGLAIVSPTT